MTRKTYETMRCDRCNHEAVIPDDGAHHGWQNVGFPNHQGTSFTGCGGIPPRFDICPKCRGDLIEWWRLKHPIQGIVA